MQRKNNNKNMNDDRCKKLSSDGEKDEDEEHYAIVKYIESSIVASNDKKHNRKLIESNVDGSEHEEACIAAECEGELK